MQQQLVDVACPVRGQSSQYILEVDVRVMPVELGRLDLADDGHGVLPLPRGQKRRQAGCAMRESGRRWRGYSCFVLRLSNSQDGQMVGIKIFRYPCNGLSALQSRKDRFGLLFA